MWPFRECENPQFELGGLDKCGTCGRKSARHPRWRERYFDDYGRHAWQDNPEQRQLNDGWGCCDMTDWHFGGNCRLGGIACRVNHTACKRANDEALASASSREDS